MMRPIDRTISERERDRRERQTRETRDEKDRARERRTGVSKWSGVGSREQESKERVDPSAGH